MFSHEEYLALRERAGIVDRSSRGRLRLTGADRRSYLQGLLTNDVAALTPGTGLYAALLTAQGRMISDMRVFETGEDILIDLPGHLAPRVSEHFSTFIFSEDVAVADVTASTRGPGVYGPRAAVTVEAALRAGEGRQEEAPGAAALNGMALHANRRCAFLGAPALVVRSDEIGLDGFDVIVPADLASALVEALVAAGGTPVQAGAAEIFRIEAGRPLFGVDMDETTIPLEAGITERAISLTKGCYVGQEIIVRVLHRGGGRVARRLVGLRIGSGPVPGPGAPIRSGSRDIGHVTSAVESPSLGPIALGYLHRDFTDPGTGVEIADGTGVHAAVVVHPPFA